MLHFRREVLLFSLKPNRFYMKFFQASPWRLFYTQVKLVSALGNKEELIGFRVYRKSATSAQTSGDG